MSVSSFAFAAEAVWADGAAGVWSLTFSIQVRMNSWKRSLCGARVGVGVGSGPGDAGPGAGHLMAGLPQRAGSIVENGKRRRSRERRQSGERKQSRKRKRNGNWRVTSLAFQTGWLNRCASF